MTSPEKNYSTALDCCRWIAAFLVLISHARHLLWVDFGDVTHKNILLKAFYFVTGLGDEAVIVFFVLSGLLVGGGALKRFLGGSYNAREYAIHRISRIYTVLLPALIIGGVLDVVGMNVFNAAQLYTNPGLYPTTPITESIAHNLGPAVLAGNILMVQHWLVPTFGSNAPLWSLASEWWFYCLFWTILGAFTPRHSNRARLCYAGAAIAMTWFLPMQILLWFFVWLLGVAMAFVDRVRVRIPALAGMAMFAGILVVERMLKASHAFANGDPMWTHFGFDLAMAIGCCILLLALNKSRTLWLGPARIHHVMAGFSYTTYLVHFPMLVFATALLSDRFGIRFLLQPNFSSALYLLLSVVGLYAYSYLIYRWTEQRTPRVRNALQRLGRFLPQAA